MCLIGCYPCHTIYITILHKPHLMQGPAVTFLTHIRYVHTSFLCSPLYIDSRFGSSSQSCVSPLHMTLHLTPKGGRFCAWTLKYILMDHLWIWNFPGRSSWHIDHLFVCYPSMCPLGQGNDLCQLKWKHHFLPQQGEACWKVPLVWNSVIYNCFCEKSHHIMLVNVHYSDSSYDIFILKQSAIATSSNREAEGSF